MSFDLSALDPTAASSPFGGLVRDGLNALPGGSRVLGAVDSYNSRRAPTDRTGAVSSSDRNAAAAPWYRKPVVLIGAGVAVLGLVVVVLVTVFRRR